MSEERDDEIYNSEISNKLIMLNQKTKDEDYALKFITEKVKSKSFKEKNNSSSFYRNVIILVLILAALLTAYYYYNNYESLAEPKKTAIFILNNEFDRIELLDLIGDHDDHNVWIWTSEGLSKEDYIEEIKPIRVPGNYKKLKDFFDYCRITGISNVHLFGDLGMQEDIKIKQSEVEKYIMIDQEFWQYFKAQDSPELIIHDNGNPSNIKDRIIKKYNKVISEK